MSIVRRIDDLGRIVIPKEVRRALRIREGDALQMETTSDGALLMQKYTPLTLKQSGYNGIRAIQKEGVACALYDRECQINGNRIASFPVQVPESWLEHRTTFEHLYVHPMDKSCKLLRVYPIITMGELYGFLAILNEDNDKDDYIRAIIQMIVGDLSNYEN